MNRNLIVALIWIVLLTKPIMAAEFDAQGNRLDPPEDKSLSYQWVDPKTGKTVTKPYPPANLQMRQVERRGNLVILEVIGAHRFADSVNFATPKSTEAAHDSGSATESCLNAIREKYNWKDPDSVRIEGQPLPGVSKKTGEARKCLTLTVNAKNSYGAYSGSKPITCILGTDHQTVIQVHDGYPSN